MNAFLGNEILVDKVNDTASLIQILKRLSNEKYLSNKKSESFRLFLRSNQPVDSVSNAILEHVCVINVAQGSESIKECLSKILFETKCSLLTGKRDELVDEKVKAARRLNLIEVEILEVLAKSKDLDDDRAIDMLAEMHELSDKKEGIASELKDIEKQLKGLRQRFWRVIEHEARLIELSKETCQLSPFYERSLEYFFDVFKEALDGNVSICEENPAKLIKKIDEAIRRNLLRGFFEIDRRTFELLERNKWSMKSIKSLKVADFMKAFENLPLSPVPSFKDHVRWSDSITPILLLAAPDVRNLIQNLYSLAEQILPNKEQKRRVCYTSIDRIDALDAQSILKEDQWLIVDNLQLAEVEAETKLQQFIAQVRPAVC